MQEIELKKRKQEEKYRESDNIHIQVGVSSYKEFQQPFRKAFIMVESDEFSMRERKRYVVALSREPVWPQ